LDLCEDFINLAVRHVDLLLELALNRRPDKIECLCQGRLPEEFFDDSVADLIGKLRKQAELTPQPGVIDTYLLLLLGSWCGFHLQLAVHGLQLPGTKSVDYRLAGDTLPFTLSLFPFPLTVLRQVFAHPGKVLADLSLNQAPSFECQSRISSTRGG
jgi:hypothetical protein